MAEDGEKMWKMSDGELSNHRQVCLRVNGIIEALEGECIIVRKRCRGFYERNRKRVR